MAPISPQGSPPHRRVRAGAERATPPNEELRVRYVGPHDPWVVDVDPSFIAALIAPWTGRRRVFLVGLLNGLSKTKAAIRAGVTVRSTQLWAKGDAEFAEAVAACENVGVATVLEAELYRRALAGPEDSGSIRALELVLRARCPDYRDAKKQ